jgi:hypothetical protein
LLTPTRLWKFCDVLAVVVRRRLLLLLLLELDLRSGDEECVFGRVPRHRPVGHREPFLQGDCWSTISDEEYVL